MYSEKNQLAKLDPSERHYCPQNHSSTKSQLTKYSLDSTGPKEAKQGLLVIYDIFGFFPQTIQGADILAYSDSEHPYQVFIPDFFEGNPADISWYPPDNEEKGKKLGEFFKTAAAPPKTLPRVPKIVQELAETRGVEKWGVVGFCWGGKVSYPNTRLGHGIYEDGNWSLQIHGFLITQFLQLMS